MCQSSEQRAGSVQRVDSKNLIYSIVYTWLILTHLAVLAKMFVGNETSTGGTE